jgi:hypothetical protein
MGRRESSSQPSQSAAATVSVKNDGAGANSQEKIFPVAETLLGNASAPALPLEPAIPVFGTQLEANRGEDLTPQRQAGPWGHFTAGFQEGQVHNPIVETVGALNLFGARDKLAAAQQSEVMDQIRDGINTNTTAFELGEAASDVFNLVGLPPDIIKSDVNFFDFWAKIDL